MGLDITAYKGIERVSKEEALDEYGELKWESTGDNYFLPRLNPHFPGRADDIQNEEPYKYQECVGLRAGPYGLYNRWREDLAKLAGYPRGSIEEYGSVRESHAASVWQNPVDGPFMELINFSDCEGVIGTEISKKLLADFKAFQGKAENHSEPGFSKKYIEWMEAFEYASENGCVEFH